MTEIVTLAVWWCPHGQDAFANAVQANPSNWRRCSQPMGRSVCSNIRAVIPSGCLPSTMAVMMSGARHDTVTSRPAASGICHVLFESRSGLLSVLIAKRADGLAKSARVPLRRLSTPWQPVSHAAAIIFGKLDFDDVVCCVTLVRVIHSTSGGCGAMQVRQL